MNGFAERNPAPAGGGEKLRWRKDVLTWKSSNNEANERPKAELEMDAHIEGNLNTELGLVMLDTLENIVQVGSHKIILLEKLNKFVVSGRNSLGQSAKLVGCCPSSGASLHVQKSKHNSAEKCVCKPEISHFQGISRLKLIEWNSKIVLFFSFPIYCLTRRQNNAVICARIC
jgi:hypothetical protein